MVFYQGVSDTNVSDKCIFHPTHRRYLQKKRNFEFILTHTFLKNFDKKKKKKIQTWWYFTKRDYFGIFKAEFLMSTTKVITQILTEVSETVNKCHCYQ